MPEEIQDIVKPLLERRLQTRNSAWIDLTGDADGKIEMTLDHKELVEKVRNKAVEMAKQARDVADEYRKRAERSVREFSTFPKQVEKLRSLVDDLRQELKKLSADVVGEAKASDKETKIELDFELSRFHLCPGFAICAKKCRCSDCFRVYQGGYVVDCVETTISTTGDQVCLLFLLPNAQR